MRLAAALLGLLAVLALTAPAHAEGGLRMTVRPGFSGVGKLGNWLPVDVQLANEGPDFTGEIQIEVRDASNRATFSRPPTVYTHAVSLPTHSNKRFSLVVFVPAAIRKLGVKLGSGGETTLQQDADVDIVGTSDLVWGVVARDPSAYEFLANLDLPGRQKRPKIVPLDSNDLPTQPQYLHILDGLVIGDASLSSMNDAQRRALEGWLGEGGVLVLSAGIGWQKTLPNLPPDVVPVEHNELKTIASIAPLGQFAREPLTDPGPYVTPGGQAKRGTVLVEQEDVPLLVAAPYGRGVVFYSALDTTAEPLKGWKGNDFLWRYFLSHSETPLAGSSFFPRGYISWGRMPRSALFNFSSIDPPSTTWLLLFIAVYAGVVGPLNYLLLRVVDRREWGWVTVPLVVGLGVFLSFKQGYSLRGSDLIINKVGLVKAEANSPVAHVRTYVGLFSPRKTDYQVSMRGPVSVYSMLYPQPREGAADRSPWSIKVAEGDGQTDVTFPLDVGITGTYMADSTYAMSGALESNLVVNGDTIQGRITNGIGQPIDDAFISFGGAVHEVGRLAPGESRDVKLTFNPNAPAQKEEQNPLAMPSLNTTRDKVSRSDILEAAFRPYYYQPRISTSGLVLAGWLAHSPLQVGIKDLKPTVKENTLLIVSLPLGYPAGPRIVVPSAVVEARYLAVTAQNRQQSDQYELASGNTLGLEFSLPIGVGKFAVDHLVLHAWGNYTGGAVSMSMLDVGEALFFNWRTLDWDHQEVGWGDNEIANPANYVSASGVVRVRYTYKPPAAFATTGITFQRFDVSAVGHVP